MKTPVEVVQAAYEAFEAEWAHVFTVANGKVTRFWRIMDTEANAAARR